MIQPNFRGSSTEFFLQMCPLHSLQNYFQPMSLQSDKKSSRKLVFSKPTNIDTETKNYFLKRSILCQKLNIFQIRREPRCEDRRFRNTINFGLSKIFCKKPNKSFGLKPQGIGLLFISSSLAMTNWGILSEVPPSIGLKSNGKCWEKLVFRDLFATQTYHKCCYRNRN